MQSFTELTLSPFLQERLTTQRFATPTPVQAAAIPPALEGKDVLATAQTGTGKTLAFMLPIIERLLQNNAPGVAALVLLPTRELAMQVADQYNALRGKQLPAAALVVGGLSESTQLNALRRGARLVVATPGRLEDYLKRRLVDFRSLQILVLDEADRMLDMGFLPAIKRIVAALPAARQTLCFSATMPSTVVHLVGEYLRNPVRLAFGSTFKPSESVRMQAFEVSHDRKQEVLERLLTGEEGRCLVFARTKRGTERLAKNLIRQGFSAAMIHGDRTQSQRTAALAGFQRGNYRILVATDVASRGIHVQNIAHVINFDLPGDAESFIHRAGRTGRMGEVGVASTLFARDQQGDLNQLERALGLRMERIREAGDSAQPSTNPSFRRPLVDRTPSSPRTPSGAPRPHHAARPGAKSFRHGAPSSRRMTRLPGELLQAQFE